MSDYDNAFDITDDSVEAVEEQPVLELGNLEQQNLLGDTTNDDVFSEDDQGLLNALTGTGASVEGNEETEGTYVEKKEFTVTNNFANRIWDAKTSTRPQKPTVLDSEDPVLLLNIPNYINPYGKAFSEENFEQEPTAITETYSSGETITYSTWGPLRWRVGPPTEDGVFPIESTSSIVEYVDEETGEKFFCLEVGDELFEIGIDKQSLNVAVAQTSANTNNEIEESEEKDSSTIYNVLSNALTGRVLLNETQQSEIYTKSKHAIDQAAERITSHISSVEEKTTEYDEADTLTELEAYRLRLSAARTEDEENRARAERRKTKRSTGVTEVQLENVFGDEEEEDVEDIADVEEFEEEDDFDLEMSEDIM